MISRSTPLNNNTHSGIFPPTTAQQSFPRTPPPRCPHMPHTNNTNIIYRRRGGRNIHSPVLTVLQATGNCSQRSARMTTVTAWRSALGQVDDDWLEGEGGNGGARMKRERLVPPRPKFKYSAWVMMLQDSALVDPAPQTANRSRRRFRLPRPFSVGAREAN